MYGKITFHAWFMMVTNVYLQCDTFSNTVVTDRFIDCINCDSFILCGDFNSSFQRANAQGNCLQQFVDRTNLWSSWEHHEYDIHNYIFT